MKTLVKVFYFEITTYFDEFLYRFQWRRKMIGGRWQLLCHKKRIYWSRSDIFVDVMSELGSIVDVIKVENWD